jgi:hypothetical protein
MSEEIIDTYVQCYQRQMQLWSREHDARPFSEIVKNLPFFGELRFFIAIPYGVPDCTHDKRTIKMM